MGKIKVNQILRACGTMYLDQMGPIVSLVLGGILVVEHHHQLGVRAPH